MTDAVPFLTAVVVDARLEERGLLDDIVFYIKEHEARVNPNSAGQMYEAVPLPIDLDDPDTLNRALLTWVIPASDNPLIEEDDVYHINLFYLFVDPSHKDDEQVAGLVRIVRDQQQEHGWRQVAVMTCIDDELVEILPVT